MGGLQEAPAEACLTVAIAVVVITSSTWLWLMYRALHTGHRDPGPVRWTVLGSVLELWRNYDRLNDWFLGYFSDEDMELTPTVSFQPNGYYDCGSRQCGVHPHQHHNKGKGNIRELLGDFLGSGFFMSDGEAWRRHRKIANTEFSTRKLREHSNTVFREDAVKLAHILQRATAANEPVEFQNLALRMMLDSICKVAFGVEMGCLSPSLPEVTFATRFDGAQYLIHKRMVNPIVYIVLWKSSESGWMVLQKGPHICLGRDSAYLQLKLTLALITHFFTFQLVPGQDITYGVTLVMPLKNGVQATLSPRQ